MTDQVGRIPAKADFACALGSSFTAHSPAGAEFPLRLATLNDSSSDVQEVYSLEFAAPAAVAAVQGTYRLVHETLGETELFLVPIRKTDTELYFEAVFNRFI